MYVNPKKRDIRSEAFTEGRFGKLEDGTFRLFFALTQWSPDLGNVDLDMETFSTLNVELGPVELPVDVLDARVEELVPLRFLLPYEVNGKRYAYIAGWHNPASSMFQYVHTSNVAKWDNPLPPPGTEAARVMLLELKAREHARKRNAKGKEPKEQPFYMDALRELEDAASNPTKQDGNQDDGQEDLADRTSSVPDEHESGKPVARKKVRPRRTTAHGTRPSSSGTEGRAPEAPRTLRKPGLPVDGRSVQGVLRDRNARKLANLKKRVAAQKKAEPPKPRSINIKDFADVPLLVIQTMKRDGRITQEQYDAITEYQTRQRIKNRPQNAAVALNGSRVQKGRADGANVSQRRSQGLPRARHERLHKMSPQEAQEGAKFRYTITGRKLIE